MCAGRGGGGAEGGGGYQQYTGVSGGRPYTKRTPIYSVSYTDRRWSLLRDAPPLPPPPPPPHTHTYQRSRGQHDKTWVSCKD